MKISDMRSVMLTLVWGIFAAGMLLSFGVRAAPRCNIGFSVDQSTHSQVNLVGKQVGDEVASITYGNISGTGCDFRNNVTNSGYKIMAESYVSVGGNGHIANNYLTDTKNIVGIAIEDQGNVGSLYMGSGQYMISPVLYSLSQIKGANLSIKLLKKLPGITVINLNEILNLNDFSSSSGKYSVIRVPETPAVINNLSTLTLIYTPACSADVNDVDFGSHTVDEIVKGTVGAQDINVHMQCEDILPSYTMNISGMKGNSDATNGIINSTNSSVGYKVTYGDNQMGTSGQAVPLGKGLTPIVSPTASDFTVPLKVKPVHLSQNAMKGGSAGASLAINLTFN